MLWLSGLGGWSYCPIHQKVLFKVYPWASNICISPVSFLELFWLNPIHTESESDFNGPQAICELTKKVWEELLVDFLRSSGSTKLQSTGVLNFLASLKTLFY